VDVDFVKQYVDIPPKRGVMIIDSRPAARQYDPGHIPGAVNIDTAKLLRSELQTYFIEAEMKYNADGSFSIKEHGK
jgi:rhodanese-related sulfurtransferase